MYDLAGNIWKRNTDEVHSIGIRAHQLYVQRDRSWWIEFGRYQQPQHRAGDRQKQCGLFTSCTMDALFNIYITECYMLYGDVFQLHR